MATAMARNGSRGSPISPPKGLNTISASSAASSVRYSANRYSSRRSASSAESGRVGVRVKDDPGGGVGSSIGGGRRVAPISRIGAEYRSQPFSRSREKVHGGRMRSASAAKSDFDLSCLEVRVEAKGNWLRLLHSSGAYRHTNGRET